MGLPLENKPRPSVCTKASSAVHSALLVGLLRAKIAGLSLISAILLITSLVKIPPTPVAPTNAKTKILIINQIYSLCLYFKKI